MNHVIILAQEINAESLTPEAFPQEDGKTTQYAYANVCAGMAMRMSRRSLTVTRQIMTQPQMLQIGAKAMHEAQRFIGTPPWEGAPATKREAYQEMMRAGISAIFSEIMNEGADYAV